MSLTKTSFEKIYRDEVDAKTKERMLLVLKVVYHGKVSAHVAGDLHRNRAWACVWLKRYEKEGLGGGLKDKPRAGRPSKLSKEDICSIKTTLKESSQGWTTKQVEGLIVRKSGIKYHHTHIYRILRRWGFKRKVPRKVHVNTASKEEKEAFKKRQHKYLWIGSRGRGRSGKVSP